VGDRRGTRFQTPSRTGCAPSVRPHCANNRSQRALPQKSTTPRMLYTLPRKFIRCAWVLNAAVLTTPVSGQIPVDLQTPAATSAGHQILGSAAQSRVTSVTDTLLKERVLKVRAKVWRYFKVRGDSCG